MRRSKLSTQDREQIVVRNAAGESYRALGKEYGVSYQAIAHICRVYGTIRSNWARAKAKIIYPGLRRWMQESDMTFTELAVAAGLSRQQIDLMLKGTCEPRKKTIDAILRATGLTYEEAFGKGGQDEN